jgi:hypothetical protein
MKIAIRILVIVAIAGGIGACLYSLGKGDLTSKESALLSIVLTGLSILASWVVTEMYSQSQMIEAISEVQEQHKSNLQTYALKAAEKVTNLSNELTRLSTYLQQELDCNDYQTPVEELHSKEERIESAIHIINTLRSVNDTSLSDWQGVIGEELEEQQEEKSEREAEVREALARMEHLVELQMYSLESRQESDQSVRSEVEALRRDLRMTLSNTNAVSVPLPRLTKIRQNVESHCPECKATITYKQSPRTTSIKALQCDACRAALVGRYDDSRGHYLRVRKPQDEKIECANCKHSITVSLDPVPGKALIVDCEKCSSALRVSRSGNSVVVRLIAPTPPPPVPIRITQVSPEIIERVAAALPPQPWPQGTHHSVAAVLGITVQEVKRAMEKLILDGRVHFQHEGRIYAQVDSPQARDLA